MPRIPLVDAASSSEVMELAAEIRSQRHGKLLKLYQVLLHSPPLAKAWLQFFTVIRQQCALPALYRELAILLIARLNGATYEFDQHVPFALSAGLGQPQIDAVSDWRAHLERFGAVEQAVLEYTEAMTREVQVPQNVFAAVSAHFAERELVELTATIGGYNMVSRFLEAMHIQNE